MAVWFISFANRVRSSLLSIAFLEAAFRRLRCPSCRSYPMAATGFRGTRRCRWGCKGASRALRPGYDLGDGRFGLSNQTRPKQTKAPRRDSVVHFCRPLSWKREGLRSTHLVRRGGLASFIRSNPGSGCEPSGSHRFAQAEGKVPARLRPQAGRSSYEPRDGLQLDQVTAATWAQWAGPTLRARRRGGVGRRLQGARPP
jgi:hypothetical protein